MVSRLERWAEDAHNNYPVEAEKIKALADEFRRAGMPDDFPKVETVSARIEVQDSAQRLIECRKRLVGVFSALRVEPGESRLTDKLAEKISQEVGQYLGDEVLIKDLFLPTFSLRQGFEGLVQVDQNTLHAYNYPLSSLLRAGYKTVGMVRGTHDVPAIVQRRIAVIGQVNLDLFKTAFARPQAGK